MLSYRDLVTRVEESAGVSFDNALLSLSVVLRAAVRQLSSRQTSLLREHIAPELRQLLAGARPAEAREIDGRVAIELIALSLGLDLERARNRALIVIEQLRGGVEIWEDAEIAELLDHLHFAIKNALQAAEVA